MWAIDFMGDAWINGRKMCAFNVIDDYNRECLCIDVDVSLPSARVENEGIIIDSFLELNINLKRNAKITVYGMP